METTFSTLTLYFDVNSLFPRNDTLYTCKKIKKRYLSYLNQIFYQISQKK